MLKKPYILQDWSRNPAFLILYLAPWYNIDYALVPDMFQMDRVHVYIQYKITRIFQYYFKQ